MLLHPGTSFLYTFDRTPIYCWLVERKIKRILNEHNTSILNIVFSFSHLATSNTTPCLLFCDWSYEFLIRNRHNRNPFLLEKIYIHHQNHVISKADYVVSLFKESADSMMQYIPDVRVNCFSKNVVNNLNDAPLLSDDRAIGEKCKAHNLLFVGRSHYINAAKQLIGAAERLFLKFPDLRLDIVGLVDDDFEMTLPEWVHCHGFLHKGNDEHRRLYYALLEKSRCFVNSSPGWGGYSSTIEAMYYYTPIVIAPYKQFLMEFGDNISFGVYVINQSEEELESAILRVMENTEYADMAKSEHIAVRDYTWLDYSQWLLELVKI